MCAFSYIFAFFLDWTMELATMTNINELIMALAKTEKLYVAVENMALGTGIGIMAAGVGVWFGGIPGILAGIVTYCWKMMSIFA